MKKKFFSYSIGHFKIQEKIMSGLHRKRLSHAYLLQGPEGTGKEALAIQFAKLLNCEKNNSQICDSCSQCLKIEKLQHPDFRFIFPIPSKKNLKEEDLINAQIEKAKNPFKRIVFSDKNTFIGIDTIRELKKESGFKTYEGRKKIYILSEADKLRPVAANAMLKLLEEPPANLLLILITSNIHKIIPTIKSRCQIMRFSQLPEEQIENIVTQYSPEAEKEHLKLIIRLSGFNIKRVFDFLEFDVLEMREHSLEFLRKLTLINRSHELLAILEKLSGQKGRNEARQILWFLLIWFLDILHLKKGHDTVLNQIHNFDKLENLKAFLSYAPNANVQKMVWDIEKSLQALEDIRNFNPVLILATLAFKLNKEIKG
jgi:DNA polymerase-3 subunit delta'